MPPALQPSPTLRAGIRGVSVAYASLEHLVASKETYREQDRADLVALLELAQRQRP